MPVALFQAADVLQPPIGTQSRRPVGDRCRGERQHREAASCDLGVSRSPCCLKWKGGVFESLFHPVGKFPRVSLDSREASSSRSLSPHHPGCKLFALHALGPGVQAHALVCHRPVDPERCPERPESETKDGVTQSTAAHVSVSEPASAPCSPRNLTGAREGPGDAGPPSRCTAGGEPGPGEPAVYSKEPASLLLVPEGDAVTPSGCWLRTLP